MGWKDTLIDILIKTGNPNLQGIITDGASAYLSKHDVDSHTDPVALLEALIDVWGPKLLESKKIRELMLETLDFSALAGLATELDVSANDISAPAITQKIISLGWSWGTSRVRVFCEFFELADAIAAYDEYSANDEDKKPSVNCLVGRDKREQFFELHTFQSDVRDRILNRFIMHEEQKILLQLPTGGGKTRVALHTVIRYLVNNRGSRKGVLWMAYDPLLLSQALETFLKLWPVLGVGEINIRCIFDDRRDAIDCEENVIYFASAQSLTNRFDSAAKELFRRSLLITVFDEAHQIVANQAKAIINDLMYQNDDLKLLGLTATPGRDYFDDQANEQFRSYFSTNVKIEPPPQSTSFGAADNLSTDNRTAITYLQELGVLANLNHTLLEYGVHGQAGGNTSLAQECYKPAALQKLALDPLRNHLIVESVCGMVAEKKKTLVFACSVQHAEDLSFFLRLRGVNVGLVLGNNRDVRERMISRFRFTDELFVLINFGVLTTGFDAPEIDSVLIARPTSSLVTYSQMLGRALRGPMNGGHAVNTVVNVSDPIFGEESEAYKKFETYWSDYA